MIDTVTRTKSPVMGEPPSAVKSAVCETSSNDSPRLKGTADISPGWSFCGRSEKRWIADWTACAYGGLIVSVLPAMLADVRTWLAIMPACFILDQAAFLRVQRVTSSSPR